MTIHPEDVRLARVYQEQAAFEGLSREQIHRIMDRGRELHRWYKAHHRLHCLIGAVLLTCMLAGDFLVLLRLPQLWLVPGAKNPLHLTLLAAVVSGALHTWLLYSLGIFTMHEGAAHHAIFPPLGPLSRAGNFLAGNLCRITGADPEYYSARHMIHHSKFGTEEDAEFLNFVSPRRYWATFLPLAGILNFSDFVIHRPMTYTKSRLPSVVISYLYHGVYGYLVYRAWGLAFLLIELFFFTHIGFYLDRLRQFTEHNLMPLDNMNGSRSFGLGFWGWLVGGGPWGTPCHWEHHLVASIPWYQQIVLHRFVVRLLTPQQRKQFLLEPFIGFPKLWWRLVRESNSLIAASSGNK
jgi:hypothetical protein